MNTKIYEAKNVYGAVVEALAFRPDWIDRWTIREMERELEPFEFKGVGWYITKGVIKEGPRAGRSYEDTLLVIPLQEFIDHDGTAEQVFLVCQWNHHLAGEAFNWIVNAPTIVDER
jgi:hypothetical protein